jgi:hypothetical protein
MRKMKSTQIFNIVLILLGVAAIFVGLFAYQLGLDHNTQMGIRRIVLIGLGVAFLLLRLALFGLKKIDQKWQGWWINQFWKKVQSSWASTKFSKWMENCIGSFQSSRFQQFLRQHVWIWGVLSCAIIFMISLWYITAGTFTRWFPSSRYYDRQADGFLAGKLSLLESPPKELAQLEDVYDWGSRVGIDYLWDITYFKDQYYLNWGPVPALLITGWKLIHPGIVDDQVLVFLFFNGLGIVLVAFFLWLRKSYFPAAPGWTVGLFTLTALLCTPVFWLINRPGVYEAAYASGQFFLVLGMYAVARGITSPGKKVGWLCLAGFSLGAAPASRLTYAFSAAAVSLVVGVTLLKNVRSRGWKIAPFLSFCLSLLLMAAGLAWFNYARFGNILESGLSYVLTGINFDPFFSVGYLLPNAYSILLRPLQFTPDKFPFLTLLLKKDVVWPSFIHLPPMYYWSEQVAGILVTIPFLWLLGILLYQGIQWFLSWALENPRKEAEESLERIPTWLAWMSALGMLSQFFMVIGYVSISERYLFNLAPLLILLTGILVWEGYHRLIKKPFRRRFLLFLTSLLGIVTIGFGLLINFKGEESRFETNNPHLYTEITHFFEGDK